MNETIVSLQERYFAARQKNDPDEAERLLAALYAVAPRQTVDTWLETHGITPPESP